MNATFKSHLLESAPYPIKIPVKRQRQRHPFLGDEFHGGISHEECDNLFANQPTGAYLVRSSNNPPGSLTLCIKFGNLTRAFKLHFNSSSKKYSLHERQYDSLDELVWDGLLNFHISRYQGDPMDLYTKANLEPSQSDSSDVPPFYQTDEYITVSKKKLGNRRSRMAMEGTPEAEAEVVVVDGDEGNQPLPIAPSISPLETPSSLPAAAPVTSPKSHNFKQRTSVTMRWCDHCSNLIWAFFSSSFYCMDCGAVYHKKCLEHVDDDCVPQMKVLQRIFGVPIETVCQMYQTPVPIVVTKCIDEMESRGALDIEGLYRVPGSAEQVHQLRECFDHEPSEVSLKDIDMYTVASLLKLYLRTLPNFLVSGDPAEELLEIVDAGEEMAKIRRVIRETLPTCHFETLRFVLCHIKKVAQFSDINHMTHRNLAVVFGPSLVFHEKFAINPLNLSNLNEISLLYEARIILLLLDNFSSIFENNRIDD